MKRLTLSEFINRCSKIHHNKYDYSRIENYDNKYQHIDIICTVHGVFSQLAGNHLYHKNGCPNCGISIRKRLNDPISEFIKVHGYKYDYSLVSYKSKKDKIDIICKEHGLFKQTPLHHLRGSGCPVCGNKKMANSLVKDKNEFLNECSDIHSNFYCYSKVEYNTLKDKVIIICPIHGEFLQRASSHKEGYGCYKCNKSRGEKRIEEFFLKNKINFIPNKSFQDCKNINTLPFDFYLPDLELCIEFDGIQHYIPIEYFGGNERLKYQQKLDKIKTDWCELNNIELLRISYKNIKDVENILKNFIYNNKNYGK